MRLNAIIRAALTCLALPLTHAASLQARWPTATISVDASKQYQIVDGWGCAEAFQRAEDVLGKGGLSAANQSYVLDLLFDVNKGAGFTILRNGIGSSNSSASNFMNTIEPVSPGRPNGTPNYTFDDYNSGQFPLSQLAKLRGLPYIYADAWSAPGFMKTNGDDMNGGSICGVTNAPCKSGDWKQAYADYLIQYYQFYAQNGVKIDYLGFLNEPSLDTTYASMLSNGTQAADFIRVLGATIEREQIDVGITCCDDYGWNQQEALIAGLQVVDSSGKSAQDYLSVITGHGYGYPANFTLSTPLRTWLTEWADLTGDYTPYSFWNNSGPGEGLTWANNIQVAFTQANVSAFLYWIGAENATSNSALISLIGDEVVPSKRFWAYAQFSKFVRPGAHRVKATSTDPLLAVTAFENANGGPVAFQILNNATADYDIKASVEGGKSCQWVVPYITNNQYDLQAQQAIAVGSDGSFTGRVPAKSLVSFVQCVPSLV